MSHAYPRPMAHVKPPPKKTTDSKVLTVIIEFLIVLGIVVGGYPLWEIFWTSYEVQGGVRDAMSKFDLMYPPGEGEPEHRTSAPPAMAIPNYGEVFGILHIPVWNYMRTPIVAGTGPDVLDYGYAGWYEGTQLPGEIGNFAMAGHRRSYGNNFRLVHRLEKQDDLVVETAEAYIVYKVINKEIVDPGAVWVLDSHPEYLDVSDDARLITLTTCHPEYGNSERFIVAGEFSYWTLKSEGKPDVIRTELIENPTGKET